MTQKRAWPAWARADEITDLLRLSVPIAISRMSVMLMSLTDAIVLGQVKGQEYELAFVLNSWLPIGISLGLGMGLLLGVQVMTSELIGQGQQQATGRVFRRGFWLAAGLGLALTVIVYSGAGPLFQMAFVHFNPNAEISADISREAFAAQTAEVTRILSLSLIMFMLSTMCSYYLEALRRPGLVMAIMYLGVIVNVIMDLAFVLGWWGMPQLGAEGVAWATTVSRTAITLALFVIIIWKTPALKPAPAGPKDEAGRQIKVGAGTAISNVAEWGGFNLTFTIATMAGAAIGTVYGYTIQVMGFCFMFFLGVGTAGSVRVAEAYGRGDLKGARDASRLGVVATWVLGAIMATLIFLLRDVLALGMVNAEAVVDGVVLAPSISALLLYSALAVVFDGLQATCSMALRAQNVVVLPSLIHIGSFFVLMIPLAFVFSQVLSREGQGMMEAVLISLIVAGLLQWGLLEKTMARHTS